MEGLRGGVGGWVAPLGGMLQGPGQQEPVLGMPALTGVPSSMQETPNGPTLVPAPSTSSVPAHAENWH